ncbi:hypothetical protein A1353_08380 [Methylomonas methanica]|uniref:Toprim domain-containing protein n=1 Tax=Methylomonas methanica TaxID=421 RepID=A0A177MQ95_METMH|nr:YfjI family protein [Methylomonas methanica]OAI07029.1 hypothetical protein A1353_08380 [Methylomonas methanica]
MSMATPDIYNGKKRVYQWTYKNPDEKILGYVGRYEDDDGNKDVIPFFKKKNGQYVAGIDLNPSPLYGLNHLAKRQDDAFVIITEGELCALALIRLGYDAVTSQGGANSAGKADWSPFENIAKVIVNPDNDGPGEKYAKDVYQSLMKVNHDIEIKILRIPNLPESGDIVDYIQRHEPDWDGYSKFDQDQITSLRKRISKLLNKAEEVPESWLSDGMADSDWLEPSSLTESDLLPVKPFDEKMLPKVLRVFVKDACYRMQTSMDFVAVSLLVGLGSLIGSGCSIRPKQLDNWAVIPNLWGVCIGHPSLMMKSPSMGQILSLLKRLQKQYFQLYEEQKVLDEIEKKEIARQIDEIEKKIDAPLDLDDDSEPEEDIEQLKKTLVQLKLQLTKTIGPRIFVVNDSSPQSLAHLHVTNERGTLVYKDELTGSFVHWDRREGIQERVFFLTAWNGNESCTDVKIGRGLTYAGNICISLLGGIQPDKLLAYLNSASNGGNDGLLQRFQLMVYPDLIGWEFVDAENDNEARDGVYSIFGKLAKMDFYEYGAQKSDFDDRPYFRFSEEAQEYVNSWIIRNRKKIENETNNLIREHLGKYNSLMPSLALIFHLVTIADSEKPKSRISEVSAKRAIYWCKYLESHARRIYGMISPPSRTGAIHLAKQIKSGNVKSPFTAKDVYDKKWSGLTKPKEVENACNILINENWLKRGEPSKPTGGRPAGVKYYINPALLK